MALYRAWLAFGRAQNAQHVLHVRAVVCVGVRWRCKGRRTTVREREREREREESGREKERETERVYYERYSTTGDYEGHSSTVNGEQRVTFNDTRQRGRKGGGQDTIQC